MTDTLPLLSGVEIEALLLRRPIDGEAAAAAAAAEGTELTYLCRKFSEAGLDVRDRTGNDKENKYLTWQLDWDGSISPAKEDIPDCGGSSPGVELISPPLPAYKPSTPPQLQEQFEELRQHVEILSRDRSGRGEYFSKSSIDQRCGLHVHFGLPGNEIIALPTLKCLALLLVVYEPTISTLHHWQRTPYFETLAGQYAKSNLIGLQKDEHTCHGFICWESVKKRIFNAPSVSALAALMGSLVPVTDDYQHSFEEDWDYTARKTPLPGDEEPERTEGRDEVWDGQLVPSQSLCEGWGLAVPSEDTAYWSSQLGSESSTTANSWYGETEQQNADWFSQLGSSWATSITSGHEEPEQEHSSSEPDSSQDRNPDHHYPRGNKFKIVRWECLDPENGGARTIEFRQAAGSLDPDEIACTMQFHAAFIFAAARMAEQNTQDLPDEDPVHGVSKPSLDSLLDLLQLSEQANQYWRDRAETERQRRVRDGREDKDLLRWERCAECANVWEWNKSYIGRNPWVQAPVKLVEPWEAPSDDDGG